MNAADQNMENIKPSIAQNIFTETFAKDPTVVFKILYHSAILVGIVIDTFYFGFYVHAYPDFTATDIVSHLVSIFCIAFLLSFMVVMAVYLPILLWVSDSDLRAWLEEGLVVSPEAAKDDAHEKGKVEVGRCVNELMLRKKFKAKVEIKSGIAKNAFLQVGIMYGLFGAFMANAPAIKSDCLWVMLLVLAGLLIYYGRLNIPKGKKILIMLVNLASFQSYILLIVILGRPPLTITEFIFPYFLPLILTALTVFIQKKHLKDFINPKSKLSLSLPFVADYLIILGFIVALSFVYSKANPFLITPYRLLKFGQYKAQLTLNPDYAKILKKVNSNFTQQVDSTITVWVLSSIGNEYIVQDVDEHDSAMKKKNRKIIKIPKKQVDLIQIADPIP